MDLSVKFALEMDDGTLSVMTFAVRSRSPTLPSGARWLDGAQRLWERPPTDENLAAEIAKAFPGVNRLGMKRPAVMRFHRIADSQLPADRTYRNAWEMRDGAVAENLEKARVIHRDRLRVQRQPLLDELDREYNRAVGQNLGAAELARIEAERQALRDITADPRISAAATIDELKAVTITATREITIESEPTRR